MASRDPAKKKTTRRKSPKPPPATARQDRFNSEDLSRVIIAIPLAKAMDALEGSRKMPATEKAQALKEVIIEGDRFSVIIDLNTAFPGGREGARQRAIDLLYRVLRVSTQQNPVVEDVEQAVPFRLRKISPAYLFARLTASEIRELVRLDNGWPPNDGKKRPTIDKTRNFVRSRQARAVFRIWPNHPVKPLLTSSVATIKGDAARAAFGASGNNIVWAVIDSGIDGMHPHFATHRNLELPAGLEHRDFTDAAVPSPLTDRFKHGTHVAGIIAGEYSRPAGGQMARCLTFMRDEHGNVTDQVEKIDKICGVAPQTKIVCYKVLDDAGQGDVTRIIAALEDIAKMNDDGRNIRIHGVNLSVGYPFDPAWFACGQSPICSVVDRLVRSGVVVVVAAGNSGYGYIDTQFTGSWAQGLPLSINDPGNAERAITVGSTHRDSPHRYGASYFSSKGPTGDGRIKPDLLAPGEKIISCNSRPDPVAANATADPEYREDSGTSMAAPHVSGAIAAFLSVRREFIGDAETVKEIFLKSATDLRRDRYLQGHGLLDLLRALQSV